MIMQQLPLGVRLQDRATFDSFVAGPNTQVLARLRSMTAGERAVVWVCGPSGSGRTHLLHAVCAAVPLALRVAVPALAFSGIGLFLWSNLMYLAGVDVDVTLHPKDERFRERF
mgnify:CR=1 FL=1